jgi:hypothetical protein
MAEDLEGKEMVYVCPWLPLAWTKKRRKPRLVDIQVCGAECPQSVIRKCTHITAVN